VRSRRALESKLGVGVGSILRWRPRFAALALVGALVPVCVGGSAPSALRDATPEESSRLRVVRSDQVGSRDSLQAVASHDRRVVAVGDNGLLLESEDAALHWKRRVIPEKPPLIDVAVCPDGRFYLLDFQRGLWVRETPPVQWTRREIRLGTADVSESPVAEAPEGRVAPRSLALICDEAGRLWAVGEQSSILRSDDGGAHWQALSPEDTDRLLTSIAFVDSRRGRVVGEFGTYFESDDGGAHWRRGPDIPGELYPQAAHFASDGRAWVVGNYGRIYRFDPGDDAWVSEPSDTQAALYGIARVGERLLAVGDRGESLVSALDGRPEGWNRLPLGSRENGAGTAYLRGIAELDLAAFVVVGKGAALRVELPFVAARHVGRERGPRHEPSRADSP